MKYLTSQALPLIEIIMLMYKGISRQNAKSILAQNTISIDGRICKPKANELIAVGQTIVLSKTTDLPKDKKPTKLKDRPSILFEDDALLIALKPAGIISSKDRNQPLISSFHKTLENYLMDRNQKTIRLWSIHRLDKEVEGLIVFAKSEQIQNQIKENWASFTKKYWAMTEKKPKENSGIIENWLKDSVKQKVVAFEQEVENSRFAKTEYRFVKTIKKYHLLEITLHTGRKNQIRVHLEGIGCPIVGDYKYGAASKYNRQIRLAAYHMQLQHPQNGKILTFEYKPNESFFNPMQADEKYK